MLRRHLRGAHAGAPRAAAISILKPLCGLDDDSADNLATFAALPYPTTRSLLGVAARATPPTRRRRRSARRWPARFRVVIQRGAPGLNPKVNQLLGLSAAARTRSW